MTDSVLQCPLRFERLDLGCELSGGRQEGCSGRYRSENHRLWRQRVALDASGQKLWLGNDYSREIDLTRLCERFVVKTDPKAKLASFPAKTQEAIKTMKVSKGMTKEQVLMSVGYPITSENPTLDAPVWRYWLSSFEPFTVVWDAQGRVQGD